MANSIGALGLAVIASGLPVAWLVQQGLVFWFFVFAGFALMLVALVTHRSPYKFADRTHRWQRIGSAD